MSNKIWHNILELKTMQFFLLSSIKMIEEKLIIVFSRAENTTANSYVRDRIMYLSLALLSFLINGGYLDLSSTLLFTI